MRILVDLKPAFDGVSGIPVEARALFANLRRLSDLRVDGLIQDGAARLPVANTQDEARGLVSIARAIAALEPTRPVGRLNGYRHILKRISYERGLVRMAKRGRPVPLQPFDGDAFSDFLWQRLFAASLPPAQLRLVCDGKFAIASVPRSDFQIAYDRAAQPLELDTTGYDAFICQSPFPGRVAKGTRMIVRLHDMVPLLLPHTIEDRRRHLEIFYQALAMNVSDGAIFACVSEATKSALVHAFPLAEANSVVIHNAVSQPMLKDFPSPTVVQDILSLRARPPKVAATVQNDDTGPTKYLLCVATLEPRKNHVTLVKAWSKARASITGLKLVLVGSDGWASDDLEPLIAPWERQGEIIRLQGVPGDELAALYRHASLTICPSVYEGFDFPSVEALACGGRVIASDIPVHREILGENATYFAPYDADACAIAIVEGVDSEIDPNPSHPTSMLTRYAPDTLAPQWAELLKSPTN